MDLFIEAFFILEILTQFVTGTFDVKGHYIDDFYQVLPPLFHTSHARLYCLWESRQKYNRLPVLCLTVPLAYTIAY